MAQRKSEQFNHVDTSDIIHRILEIMEAIHDYQYDKEYIPSQADIQNFVLMSKFIVRLSKDTAYISQLLQERSQKI